MNTIQHRSIPTNNTGNTRSSQTKLLNLNFIVNPYCKINNQMTSITTNTNINCRTLRRKNGMAKHLPLPLQQPQHATTTTTTTTTTTIRRRPRIMIWKSCASDTSNDRDKDDTEASDLSLPNLTDMFSEGGKADCQQCEGKGEISCVVCNGTGMFSLTMMDTTSATTCRMCRGRRCIPCPTCRSFIYKSVVWWDQIPDENEDPDENWRQGKDGDGPRISWGGPPNKL